MKNSVEWVYVSCPGRAPNIMSASDPEVAITRIDVGQYRVTFPTRVAKAACIASVNSSHGVVTAIPGEACGQPPNVVTVYVRSTSGDYAGSVDFSLAVFYDEARGRP